MDSDDAVARGDNDADRPVLVEAGQPLALRREQDARFNDPGQARLVDMVPEPIQMLLQFAVAVDGDDGDYLAARTRLGDGRRRQNGQEGGDGLDGKETK